MPVGAGLRNTVVYKYQSVNLTLLKKFLITTDFSSVYVFIKSSLIYMGQNLYGSYNVADFRQNELLNQRIKQSYPES